MIYVALGIAIVAVALLAALLVIRRRRPSDTVADFQRQIGALSAQARRPVVDQVNRLDGARRAGRSGETGESGESDAPGGATPPGPPDGERDHGA